MKTAPATVLVIEKHPLMRAAICNAIADEPDLVIGAIAADGLDTFQIVENLHPQMILLSLGVSGEEGLDVLKKIHEKFPNLAILALTDPEAAGQERAALNSGANATLIRTSQRADFLNSLRSLRKYPSQDGNSTLNRSGREENSI